MAKRLLLLASLVAILSQSAIATTTSLQDPISGQTLQINSDRSVNTNSKIIGGTITAPSVTTANITNVSTSTGSAVTLVAANSLRSGLILTNLSAGYPCYIAFGSGASPTHFTIQLSQGMIFTMDTPIYQGIMTAYCNSGSILVTEM